MQPFGCAWSWRPGYQSSFSNRIPACDAIQAMSAMPLGLPQVSTTVFDGSMRSRSIVSGRSRGKAAGTAEGSFAGSPKRGGRRFVPPPRAELRVGQISRGGTAHGRDVDEVEGLRLLDLEKLAVVGKLLASAIRVQERVPGRMRRPVPRLEVELLHHRGERGEPRPGADHQHVLESLGALLQGEVADDALDVGEVLVRPIVHPAEE